MNSVLLDKIKQYHVTRKPITRSRVQQWCTPLNQHLHSPLMPSWFLALCTMQLHLGDANTKVNKKRTKHVHYRRVELTIDQLDATTLNGCNCSRAACT